MGSPPVTSAIGSLSGTGSRPRVQPVGAAGAAVRVAPVAAVRGASRSTSPAANDVPATATAVTAAAPP
nr:hypothetical protein GCM10020092_041020 [Actinoplanes digitatis]